MKLSGQETGFDIDCAKNLTIEFEDKLRKVKLFAYNYHSASIYLSIYLSPLNSLNIVPFDLIGLSSSTLRRKLHNYVGLR